MGYFDSVIIPCPKCHSIITFSSQAGECEMKAYHVSNAPKKILEDIEGSKHFCSGCEKLYKVEKGKLIEQDYVKPTKTFSEILDNLSKALDRYSELVKQEKQNEK